MTIYDIDIELNSNIWAEEIPNIEVLTKSIIEITFDQLINNISHIEISIVLADDGFLKKMNTKYRGKNAPTNVLSFPMTEPEELLSEPPFISMGDIIFAYETIKSEATEQGKSIKNHFTHMLVHGCLHLLHYDHMLEKDAIEMETLEVSILKSMGIKNPYKT